ncbi:MAG: type IV-A pilus assembly ATPase PilB [Candidatus Latescibacteria bacterium]|jgi:type IV pilus assembly protein PilB|nr:type IV-A pilus assembly ATPase PilB [Candidatus Latescibacterota bacterium]
MAGARIGNLLVKDKKIDVEQLEEALKQQREKGGNLGKNLIELGYVNESDLIGVLAKQLGVDTVDLKLDEVDEDVINLIPAEVAMKFNVVSFEKTGKVLKVAIADPTNSFALDSIKLITGCKIEPFIATENSIRSIIEKVYSTTEELSNILDDFDSEEVEIVEESEEDVEHVDTNDAPLVRLVNSILVDAVKRGVSDIHIEPFEKEVRIRFRQDGSLMEMPPLPNKLKAAVTSRLKIMSDLDISERRVPQDGRIKIRMQGKAVEFRVSSLPTLFGEKIVMRILDQGNLTLDLTTFGFTEKALKDFTDAVDSPYGMVLVTGPTGSGKTTTLYSALSRINDIGVNIMTAEDPVEYNLYGVNQTLVRTEVGMTFAAALKAFLRQDPNIIMIGEIRDIETGGIAVKAALTGHLVLSTLHTNDAPSTVTRMIDMGIAPFQIASAVNLIQGQRLLRKLCNECKKPIEVPKGLHKELDIKEGDVIYSPVGCPKCGGKGKKGRIGAYEVMAMTPALRKVILNNGSTEDIREQAVKEGMLTLRMDAVLKMKQGIVDYEEVVRETMT